MFFCEKSYLSASKKINQTDSRNAREMWYKGKSLALRMTSKLNVKFNKLYTANLMKTGADFYNFIKEYNPLATV